MFVVIGMVALVTIVSSVSFNVKLIKDSLTGSAMPKIAGVVLEKELMAAGGVASTSAGYYAIKAARIAWEISKIASRILVGAGILLSFNR